jgi:hypothetical protein
MPDALSGLVSRVIMDSPYICFFTICALSCLCLRIWTGYQNARIQSNATASEKEIPTLPYWLPYFGHAPALAWSFDNLLAKGRFVFESSPPPKTPTSQPAYSIPF